MIRFRMIAIPALCLGWALLIANAGAAPVPPDSDKKTEFPAEKCRKSLEQRIDLDIADQPLPSAITTLREQTKINFVLDTPMLTACFGDPNSLTVSIKQKNIKVRSALRNILGQRQLGYAILGDSVFISTEDMALQGQLRQRVSLNLDGVPLAEALKQLGRETVTNVLIDAKVKKNAETEVTLQLDDVPLETAVRLLAELAGLKPVRMGNVLYVTSKAKAIEIRSEPDLLDDQPGARSHVNEFTPAGVLRGLDPSSATR